MKCQVHNCKNDYTRVISTHGIYNGTNLDHVCLYVCECHTENEINESLAKEGEKEVNEMLLCNPFNMINENQD